jgi:hypothetical protein
MFLGELGVNTADEELTYFQTSFAELRERLIRVLGAPTVDKLVDRAISEIRQVHPAIASLSAARNGTEANDVKQAFANVEPSEIRNAFMALDGVLILLVARLLGREIAERLTEGISIAEYLRREGFA